MSSLKTKKGEATVGKKPKFIYVPENPQPKTNSFINEEGGSKTTKEVSSVSKTKNEQLANKNTTLDSPGTMNKLISEGPLRRASCTIEEFFYDLDDGLIDNT